MSSTIKLLPNIALGIVPTHIKFVGGLVPDGEGNFPRESDGSLSCVAEMKRICETSPVRPTCVQIPFFAGAKAEETNELIQGLKNLGLAVHLILMVGGANPINPNDEDAVVAQLVPSLKAAIQHEAASVSSTSIEEWMNSPASDLDTAIAQNVKLHIRAAKESGLLDSSIGAWHIEFLRPGEFNTFTNIAKAWAFVKAANQALGRSFFKLLVDAAHCGDSDLSLAENQKILAELAAAGEMGIFHASAKTTRGCLSTDDGWISSLLTTAAKTGKLETVFVEIFHHEDPALEALRKLEPGHGINTLDGRDYTTTLIDGLIDITRRLNNLQKRGMLP